MAKVQLMDGSTVRAPLTDVKQVGDEGSWSAMAHINGRAFPVYKSIIDGFNEIWVEQEDRPAPIGDQIRLVAEKFYYQWLASDVSPEDQIASIAELISYGGDLDEIMRKMALM